MSMLDKFESRFNGNSSPLGGVKDVFFKFKTGVNRIRLVGDMVESRAHYLAGNSKRGNRGLCPPMAFEGDEKIFSAMNCPDWDASTETKRTEKTCPICQLQNIAQRALASGKLNDATKAFYEELKQNSKEMTSFKVNIIDRDDPYITVVENGTETKQKGLKIASLTYTVAKKIYELSRNLGFGIENADKGIDIEVVRTDTNGKTSYDVRPVFEGIQAKVTPLTAEERSYQIHDLVAICSREVDVDKTRAALHGDLISLLDKYYPQRSGASATPPTPIQQTAPVEQTGNTLDDITAQSMSEAETKGSVLDQFPQNQTLGEDIELPF